jgi:hypothetical protein
MKTNKQENKGLSIAGFVLSILSLLMVFMPYFGLPLAIIGLILSSKSCHTLTTAGKIINIVSIVINGILLFVVICLIITMPHLIGF